MLTDCLSDRPLSLLDGIPVALKDNFCVKGTRMTCASRMLYDYVAPFEATVTQKLIHESGAVMMGKTNMDEFAIGSGCMDSVFGPCVNPWPTGRPMPHTCGDAHVPGGSSGGSAVAVATGAVFAALGSDTGGSTRYPAALTGIVGFKPTYGLISRHGLVPLSHSLDTVGILARYVEDVHHLLEQLRGFDHMDSTCIQETDLPPLDPDLSLSDVRFGVSDDYTSAGMSAEVVDLIDQTCGKLSDAGASVRRVSLPHTKYATSCYTILNAAEIASNFACYDGIEYGFRVQEEAAVGDMRSQHLTREQLYEANRSHGFGDPVKGRIQAGNYFLLKDNYDKYMLPAYQMRRVISEELTRVLRSRTTDGEEGVDVLLTPVSRGTAHRCQEWMTQDNREQAAHEDVCTQPANLSGMPAITIPCTLAQNGLPLGLQLIASPLGDNRLLSVALQLQKLFNFPILKMQGSA